LTCYFFRSEHDMEMHRNNLETAIYKKLLFEKIQEKSINTHTVPNIDVKRMGPVSFVLVQFKEKDQYTSIEQNKKWCSTNLQRLENALKEPK
jgi:hypothetical protein